MRWEKITITLSLLVFFSFTIAQQKETSPREKIAELEKKVMTLEKQVGLLEKRIIELERKLSELEKRLPPATTVKPTPAPKVTPTEKPSFYIGNARTKKFHRPECEWAQKIAPYNRVTIKSREEAIKQGYEPCKVCRP